MNSNGSFYNQLSRRRVALDEFRDNQKPEWFSIDFDTAKSALDAAHMFLDGMVNRCRTLALSSFNEKLKEIVESLEEDTSSYSIKQKRYESQQEPIQTIHRLYGCN